MVGLSGLEKFSHLEDKIYRTIELTKSLRQENENLQKELAMMRRDIGNVLNEKERLETHVEKLLAALPENKRRLMRQVKIEGLSTTEAARSSGMSESAVKVGVHRALKTLSAMIGRNSSMRSNASEGFPWRP